MDSGYNDVNLEDNLDNNLENFNGIEIATLHDNHNIDTLRHKIAKNIFGIRTGLTIIGPASIIKELNNHPEMLEMHFEEKYIQKLKSKKTFR